MIDAVEFRMDGCRTCLITVRCTVKEDWLAHAAEVMLQCEGTANEDTFGIELELDGGRNVARASSVEWILGRRRLLGRMEACRPRSLVGQFPMVECRTPALDSPCS